jgi:thymidine kinase
MFSGKSSRMVGAIERFARAGKRCVIISHCLDKRRYGEIGAVRTHDGCTHDKIPMIYSDNFRDPEITDVFRRNDIIGIDEFQFFAQSAQEAVACVNILEAWVLAGKTIICAGLDTNWKREPFAMLAPLVARADSVTKLLAVCGCGSDAPFSARIRSSEAYVDPIGGEDKYVARCRKCYTTHEMNEQ